MEFIRTVVTENSIWKFDIALCRYVRFPRHEVPDPVSRIPYTAQWEPYTAIERHADRVIVHRPVPWGEGALRMTGPIDWDDLEDAELAEHSRQR